MLNPEELERLTPDELDKLMAESEARLAELRRLKEYTGPGHMVTSHEVFNDLRSRHPSPRIEAGFKGLQALVDGWEPGELIVISGATGEGKTTLLQSLTDQIARKGVVAAWFNFEVNMRTFLSHFGDTIDKIPMFSLPHEIENVNFKWIRDRIYEAKVKHEASVVCIDHLHYLLEMNNMVTANSSFVVGTIMRELKKLAIELNVVIFLVAHMTKTEEGERPKLSDLRDSSFIAQEADQVYMIQSVRDEHDPDSKRGALLYVKKNRRNGETGKIALVMRGGLFYERV